MRGMNDLFFIYLNLAGFYRHIGLPSANTRSMHTSIRLLHNSGVSTAFRPLNSSSSFCTQARKFSF
jgi:hypothetical protein